jgi:hypothetical protein
LATFLLRFRLPPHEEEDEEGEQGEPGGAKGGLTESHLVDLVHSGSKEQAAYYKALLHMVDEYMQEVD